MRAINEEIERLTNADTTYQNCQKLAVLYSIKDHNTDKVAVYSHASSKFMKAVAGVPMEQALTVLDEHMEAIQLLYPKEYTAICDKLNNLK
ncbi:MAG: hypothetical protein MJ007_01970 [Paludibacteraceae bacterium]|nr:hypothetical protein [Paludibacteraceae bacterium]